MTWMLLFLKVQSQDAVITQITIAWIIKFLQPKDVDKLLGEMWSITSVFNSYPLWLLISVQNRVAWYRGWLSACLQEQKVSIALKQAAVKSLLKKSCLSK